MQNENLYIRSVKNYFKDIAGVLFAFVLVCLIFGGISKSFFSSTNITTILRQSGLNSIVAFGMTLVIISGGIDLSVGGTMVVSGIISAYAFVNWNFSILPMILVTLGVGITVGLVNGIVVAYVGLPPFIVTLGTQLITQGLAGILSNNRPIQLMYDEFNNLALGKVGNVPVLVIYMFVLFLLTAFCLNKTKLGRHIYAIGGNIVTANYSGIRVKPMVTLMYIINGALAALAGMLTAAKLYSGQPTVGSNAEIDAISAVVIGGASFTGGKGCATGTLIGVLLICVISNGLNLMGVSTFWQKVANGCIIILAVSLDILKNSGLLSHWMNLIKGALTGGKREAA